MCETETVQHLVRPSDQRDQESLTEEPDCGHYSGTSTEVLRQCGYLDDVLPWRQWRAVQEAVVVRVPLGETQPLWEVGEVLSVALEGHGVIIQATSLRTSQIISIIIIIMLIVFIAKHSNQKAVQMEVIFSP